MGKPHQHAASSAKKFGGQMQDYLEVHLLLDSSKMAFADNRHRALTHNSWFINHILPKIFGNTITNSDGKLISVIDIAEQHILEDFNYHFIPTAQDYLTQIINPKWPSEIISINENEQKTLVGIMKCNKMQLLCFPCCICKIFLRVLVQWLPGHKHSDKNKFWRWHIVFSHRGHEKNFPIDNLGFKTTISIKILSGGSKSRPLI